VIRVAKRQSLGKGLRALIPDLEPEVNEPLHSIDITKVIPNPYQPRQNYDPEKMEELVASIREHGIIQPIVVRVQGDFYQIVAGERRWRAAKEVGLKEVPVVVRDFSDLQMMEIALIENLQREDLNPIEEAEAYRKLIDKFELTQEQLARRLGKSRPAIANALRILNLPSEVLEYVSRGTISSGHAKALLALNDSKKQISLAKRIVEEGLSVRETEALVQGKKEKQNVSRGTKRLKKQPPEILELENQLSMAVGTKVFIKQGKGKGKIEIEFYNDSDLERIVSVIIKEKREELLWVE